jgi:hypothetical protein
MRLNIQLFIITALSLFQPHHTQTEKSGLMEELMVANSEKASRRKRSIKLIVLFSDADRKTSYSKDGRNAIPGVHFAPLSYLALRLHERRTLLASERRRHDKTVFRLASKCPIKTLYLSICTSVLHVLRSEQQLASADIIKAFPELCEERLRSASKVSLL